MAADEEKLRAFTVAWVKHGRIAGCAAQELGYKPGGSAWVHGSLLLRQAKKHPRFSEWVFEAQGESAKANLAPAQPRTSGPYFPPDVQSGPGILATPPLKDAETLRRETLASRLGVKPADIPALPEAPVRWDLAVDKLAGYRNNPDHRPCAQVIPKRVAMSYVDPSELRARQKKQKLESHGWKYQKA